MSCMLVSGVNVVNVKRDVGVIGDYSREGGCWFYNWVEDGENCRRLEASKYDMF